MSAIVPNENLFRPNRSQAEKKADVTDRTARAMIEAEVESREAKTARLKQARLAMEAKAPPAPEKKARGGKAAKKG